MACCPNRMRPSSVINTLDPIENPYGSIAPGTWPISSGTNAPERAVAPAFDLAVPKSRHIKYSESGVRRPSSIEMRLAALEVFDGVGGGVLGGGTCGGAVC